MPDNKQAMCPPAGRQPQQPGRLPAQGQFLPREQRSTQTPSEQVVGDQLDGRGAGLARLNLWKRGVELKIWAGEVGRGAAGGRHLKLIIQDIFSLHTQRGNVKAAGRIILSRRGAG